MNGSEKTPTEYWAEAEARPGMIARWHAGLAGWVLPPSTYPEVSTELGDETFCHGSPRRFRDHEYVDDACRYCPRRKKW